MNPTRLTNEMSSTNLTFSQKIVQTIKRFAVGLPMLFIIFGVLQLFIPGMAAVAVALIVTGLFVNIYFA
jgi:uncharacterized membrane protein